MQVTLSKTDSGPGDADLFIHVRNKVTCPLHQKLRAFKMHIKVGVEVRFLGRSDLSYYMHTYNVTYKAFT